MLPKLTALVAGLVVALVLAEVTLRLWPQPPGQPRLPLSYDVAAIDRLASGDAYVRFSPTLGWEPTPGVERSRDDTTYRHNSQGMRAEQEYSTAPRAGIRRILAYGDSFTYCEEVDLDVCWTTILEEGLRRSEVLNFGAPGYGPDQAWLRFQEGGAGLAPCTVLIGVMVENINRVVNRFRPFYYAGTGIPLAKPRYVLDQGVRRLVPTELTSVEPLKDPRWVEANLGPGDVFYFPNTFVRSPLDALEVVNVARTAAYRKAHDDANDWTPDWARVMYRPGSEGFEILVSVLAGFAGDVRTAGATPIVLVFPWKGEIEDQRRGRPKIHEPLLTALEERQIAVVDLTEALGSQALRDSIGSLVGNHYRALGNSVVGRTLAREVPRLAATTCNR